MTFDVLLKDFENALVRYKVTVGKSWSFVVKQQGRLVAEKLLKFTPPKTQAIGRKHIETDIGKVFADLGNTKWENRSLNKMWRQGNFEGVKKALSSHPEKETLPIFQYERIFQKPIRAIHKAALGKNGRIPKRWQTRYAVGGRGEQKKYIRQVQKQVGIAKSGWLAAVQRLGGKAPAWVSRHGATYGKCDDKTQSQDPSVDIVNQVKTFPRGVISRILQRAVRAQTHAMLNHIKRILDVKKI